MAHPQAALIAQLNDAFRQNPAALGRCILTPAIAQLPMLDQRAILHAIAAFNTFHHANDPHRERDFGRVEHQGEPIFWKIDYYDQTYEYGSQNPADPQQTKRVMTVMFAHEY